MLREQMTKLLACFFIVGSIMLAGGADFKPDRTLYVSAKGADTNDGLSEKNALKTIGKAAETVKPGDLVIVKGGKYYEHLTLEKSGTPEKPIVFRAAPDETVLVTWGWDINGWKKVEDTRFIYEASFPYAVNMLWERKNLIQYLQLESMELLDKQPGGFVFDKKTGKIFVHAFDGGNPGFSGIVAVPFSDTKKPVPYNNETSKIYRWNKGFCLKGSCNTVEGFELAFFPTGAQIRGEAGKCVLRNNTVYGTTTALASYNAVGKLLFENNRAYRNTGPGIIIEGNNRDVIVRNNYLFNNGHCPPFAGQDNGSGGHPYNLAQYGGKEVFNVSFIGNTVISDEPSRRVGVMRCKGGVDGNMDVAGNVFVGGGPIFYPKPDSKALIEKNTLVGGDISYASETKDGREYKPELKDNLCVSGNKEKPCFADASFYDYRLRKDSPFIGKGAYPGAGQIFYVNVSAKDGGDGSSPEKAFKSLSAALEKAVPGNCIYMLPGTYGENISIAKKESVTLRNYGKGKVVLENASFVLKECGKLCFDGMIFRNSKVRLENSDGMEFLHCVFDGEGIAAENCGSLKVVNNTFVKSGLSASGAGLVLRNNLFIDCKSLPVQSDPGKTISENNVFSGGNAGELLNEWNARYSEGHPSFAEKVKLQDAYMLPDESRLVYSGLGWTFIGALGPEKKKREIMVEELKAVNVLSDRIVLKWYTPFDYPDVKIICKDGKGKAIYRADIMQGQYKQTEKSECIKGLEPETQYEISFAFSSPGAAERVEKKMKVTTTGKKIQQPKTIYVSTSGNDSANGLSAKNAKKTIFAALGIASGGDTVLVAPGVYAEQNNIDIDGLSKDRPFVLKSEKPGKAILSANYVLDTILRINQGKYITVDGFKFSGLRYSAIATAMTVSKSEGITLRNCIFDRNWKREGGGCSNVQFRCSDSKDLEISNCIFDTGFHGVWTTGTDNVKIFNNTFWHIGINGIHAGCTKDYKVEIYNNIFEDVVANHASPAVSTGESGSGIFCDYNIYWKTEAVCPTQKIYGSGGMENSATWSIMKKDIAETIEDARKMYGVEKHGQFADPLLKDPKNGDFSLKPGSPAIGKGRNGSNIGADMGVFAK